MSFELAFALLAAPSLGVLLLNVANVVFWPRGRDDASFDGRVVALIPCRNEEATIEACVRGLMNSRPALAEVVVFDDGSTDSTPRILEKLGEEFDRLRVERGGDGLPEGWVGKPHACHRLARAVLDVDSPRPDILLFVDADVSFSKTGLGRVASLLKDREADVATIVPRQLTGSIAERVVLPLLHLTYTSWLFLPLIWRTHDPRFLAANGQILAVRRETYEAVGGFEAVRNEVVDDMAFCRLAKREKKRVLFGDGHRIASCRMYENARGVWEGFSKNLYEGIGARALALLFVLSLYVGVFIVPWIALLAGIWISHQALALAAAIGVLAHMIIRAIHAARFQQPVESIVLHPVSILAFCAIAINSAIWHARGSIRWAGRTYAAKSAR